MILNEASAKIVDSYDTLQKDTQSELSMDEWCQKFKTEMDTVLQSCANQNLVSKEVYTERHSKWQILPHDYTINKLFNCYVCKRAFSNEKQLTRHVCTKKT